MFENPPPPLHPPPINNQGFVVKITLGVGGKRGAPKPHPPLSLKIRLVGGINTKNKPENQKGKNPQTTHPFQTLVGGKWGGGGGCGGWGFSVVTEQSRFGCVVGN